ncbi:MAG: TolB family protein [Phycisphaerae bacterium]
MRNVGLFLICTAVAAAVLSAAPKSADTDGDSKPRDVNAPTTRPFTGPMKPEYPAKASGDERAALDALAEEVSGAVVFGRKGTIYRVVIGHWKQEELCEGDFARWSADGRSLAVWDGGKVFHVDARTGERKLLVEDADKKDGCPVEYHSDGKHIIFWRKKGFHAVEVESGKARKLDLPGTYSGSPNFSADGETMVARWGRDLYVIDTTKGEHRKYARGCSPGVSPNGRWLMNNDGSHRTVTIRPNGKGKRFRIDIRTCRPDRSWDNHHWSNHNDYIAAQGDGKNHESYVVRISKNRCTRISWLGRTAYPDVWIAPRSNDNRKASTGSN